MPPSVPLGVWRRCPLCARPAGAVGEHPAVVRVVVAVAGEGDVDVAAEEQQSGAVEVVLRIEGDRRAVAADAGAGHRSRDLDRAARDLVPGEHVERVQALVVDVVLEVLAHDVEAAGRRIDDRGRGHAGLRVHVAAGDRVRRNDRLILRAGEGPHRRAEGLHPQRRGRVGDRRRRRRTPCRARSPRRGRCALPRQSRARAGRGAGRRRGRRPCARR